MERRADPSEGEREREMRKEGNGERSLHGGVADSHQIFGAQEQYIQIFILPCKWSPSFSFLFGAARRVIMQTKTCFKMKGTTYMEEEIQ